MLWYANLSLVPGQLRPWSPFTYGLLHDSALHLSINMLGLWVFGQGIERAVGRLHYGLFFAASVIITGLVQVAFVRLTPGADRLLPIIGASGAVAAMAGLFAVRYYRERVAILGLPRLRVPAVLLVAGLALLEMSQAGYRLATQGADSSANVAHFSHIAGFVLGMGWGYLTRQQRAGKTAYQISDAHEAARSGDALSAVQRWERVLESQPDNVIARAELAKAWATAGDPQEAQTLFTAALEGMLRRSMRQEAARRFAEMYTLVGDLDMNPDLRFRAASALLEYGYAEEAMRQYRRTAQETSDPEERSLAQLRAASVLTEALGRHREAAAALSEWLKTYPDSVWISRAEQTKREAEAKAAATQQTAAD